MNRHTPTSKLEGGTHAARLEDTAIVLEPLATKELIDDLDRLSQCRQRLCISNAQLLCDPQLDTGAKAKHGAAFGDVIEGSQFHRGLHRVARPRIEHADSDLDFAGVRRDRRSGGEGAGEYWVFRHPKGAEAEFLGQSRGSNKIPRLRAFERDTEFLDLGHCGNLSSCRAATKGG